MSTINFQPGLLDKLYLTAEQSFPEETCGILIGHELDQPAGTSRLVEQLIPASNIAEPAHRHNRFLLDPKDLLAAQRLADTQGLAVLGIYHSHPNGSARPSATDLESAWPVYSYVIVSVLAGRVITAASWILDAPGTAFLEQTLVNSPA